MCNLICPFKCMICPSVNNEFPTVMTRENFYFNLNNQNSLWIWRNVKFSLIITVGNSLSTYNVMITFVSWFKIYNDILIFHLGLFRKIYKHSQWKNFESLIVRNSKTISLISMILVIKFKFIISYFQINFKTGQLQY